MSNTKKRYVLPLLLRLLLIPSAAVGGVPAAAAVGRSQASKVKTFLPTYRLTDRPAQALSTNKGKMQKEKKMSSLNRMNERTKVVIYRNFKFMINSMKSFGPATQKNENSRFDLDFRNNSFYFIYAQ